MFVAQQIFFLESGIVRVFAANRDVDGWEAVANSWIIETFILATICCLIMIFAKLSIKQGATVISTKSWARSRMVIFLLVGFALVLVAELIGYLSSRDFQNIIGVQGLLFGILVAWAIYVFVIGLFHSVGSWRRDLFGG